MSKKDYSKQLERRQRIKETTLVVGADIWRQHNAVGFMNKEGKELGKYPKVYNSRPIHRNASDSLTFPKYICVVLRS